MCNYEDYLWSKFQLSLTLFTGVIVPRLPPSHPTKKYPMGSWTKKKLLFLLGKVETNKYSEAETWHRWMVLLLAIWEFLDVAQGVIYKFEHKNLILQEFCYFLGPGGLYYLILLRCFFPETLVLVNIFGFPAVNWVPKWTKNSKFRRIFQTLCFPCWKTTSGQNISKTEQYFGGVRTTPPPSHPPLKKGTISWLLNQYEKLF